MRMIIMLMVFVAGQAYLLKKLIQLDHLPSHPHFEDPNSHILSVVFPDEATSEAMRDYLAGFSVFFPDIQVTVLISEDVYEAVYTAPNAVGILEGIHAETVGMNDLRICAPTQATPSHTLIWIPKSTHTPVNTFVQYLWDRNAVTHGNSGEDVVE